MGFQSIVILVIESIFPTDSKRRNYINIVGKPVARLFGFHIHDVNNAACMLRLYEAWMLKREPSETVLETQKSEKFRYEPKISLILTTTDTPVAFLKLMVASVLGQTYSNWELCIAYVGSESQVKHVLDLYAGQDSRIKLIDLKKYSGRSEGLNAALVLATGDFVVPLGSSDELALFALYETVKLLNEDPAPDLIYSDEDRVSAESKRFEPSFKPDWSPDYLLSCNYIGFFIIRKSTLDSVGGFRPGFGGTEYDLLLRVTERTRNIAHISKVLCHKRECVNAGASSTEEEDKGIKALAEAVERRRLRAEVLEASYKGFYRVKYEIIKPEKVSIIIPTKDKVGVLKKCITSVLQKTTYSNYEVIIVDNQSSEDETFAYYKELETQSRIRIIKYDKPFNFSLMNNYAVEHSTGHYLLFLNNDTEVISPEWIESMVEYAQRKSTGVVGAKLFYPDDTIQHAGVIIGMGGVAAHTHKHYSKDLSGYGGRIIAAHNLSAVTAACMMVRREVFDLAEGFDANFAVAYNDIDLCVKIRDAGYLVVYTPYAELYHHESLSRGYDDTTEKQEECQRMAVLFWQKWRHFFPNGDPYYNPNLTLTREDFSVES